MAACCKELRTRPTRCARCWTRSTPCAPARRSESPLVSLPAERARGLARGTIGRTLRQEGGAGARRAARIGRPTRSMGGGAAGHQAATGLDARAVGRRRTPGEARARDLARRASRLAAGVHIFLAVSRAAREEPAGRHRPLLAARPAL